MYARMDFDPAETAESELFGIDFVYDLSRLSQSEHLASAIFTLAVVSGVDASPASRLVGSPSVAVNPFNGTGLVTMAVQRIAGLLAGVVYSLKADVVTNNANTLSLWSRIGVEDPPTILQGSP